MTYVDTHHHLILRDRLGYAWTSGIAELESRNFTLDDYAADTSGRVAQSFFMETGVDDADYKEEARFIAGQIDQGRFAGQIASCRLAERDFEAWLDECGGLGVRAFRQILHVVPDTVSDGPMFRANLALMGRRDYPFELCLRADQLRIGVELAQANPSMRFILNHCGNPDIASGGFDAWANALARFKGLETVAIKLSGITANARQDQQSDAVMFPYMRRVIDIFGPERVVWGSDWPVCNTGMGLPSWIATCDRFLSAYSPSEAADIRMNNALRLYGGALAN